MYLYLVHHREILIVVVYYILKSTFISFVIFVLLFIPNSITEWKNDYWFNFDQAMALNYMIEKGYKSSEKIFDVMDKRRRKQNRRN